MKKMKTLTIDEHSFELVDGNAVRSFYSTTREESELKYFADIKSTYIWGLYDALMAKYPDKVQKNEIRNDDGTFTNYEYVISTGDYTTDGYYCEYGSPDPQIKKPKYLLLTGIHGSERNAALSAYRFIRDVLNGHNVPKSFHESRLITHIIRQNKIATGRVILPVATFI